MAQRIVYEDRPPTFPNTANVLKNTLLVSILFHLCLLGGLQETLHIKWLEKPLKIYHVELVRPPVDPADNEAGADTKLTNAEPNNGNASETSVDTISLDTKDKRYSSYAQVIKARLSANWGDYPKQAWENLIEGEVMVLFSLDRKGQLMAVEMLHPSPFEVLNRDTERTIRASAPFPPFPASVTVNKLNIKARFEYRLPGT